MKMMFGLATSSTVVMTWGFHSNPDRLSSSTKISVMEELPNKITVDVITGLTSFLILVCVFFNAATLAVNS